MKILDKSWFKYILWVFFALQCYFSFIIFPKLSHKFKSEVGDVEMLDLRRTYSGYEAFEYIDTIGPIGRAMSLNTYLKEDFIYPIVYGLLFFLSTIYFLRKSFPNSKLSYLFLISILPFFATGFDFAENYTVVQLISNYPTENIELGNLAGKFTFIKWCFVLGSMIILAVSMLIYGVKKYILRKI